MRRLTQCMAMAPVREVEFEYTDDDLKPTGQTVRLMADQVFRAIGQTLQGEGLPDLEGRKIKVSDTGATSVKGIWAGGDCASGGDDSDGDSCGRGSRCGD